MFKDLLFRGTRSLPGAFLLLALLLVGGCGGHAPDDARPVLVSVTAEPAAVTPGGRVTLLWRFRLADHWHLYWTGRNDSGFPPEIELDLPEGWIAGGLQWPTPERLVSAGEILDHVYHDELVLLQQLAAPADAQPGDELAVSAGVRWLACKDACVPGKAQVDLRVPVLANVPTASSALAAAKERMPRELPDGMLDAAWDGATFRIRLADAGIDARRLAFLPTSDCGNLVDLVADGERDGRVLELRFALREGTAGPVRGLLAVTGPEGAVRGYNLSHPATIVPNDNPGG